MSTKWNAKGVIIGACSCDWGCPCSFDAHRPKENAKAAMSVFHRRPFRRCAARGSFDDVAGAFSRALHKGNVTGLTLIDEKANPAQRAALTKLSEGKSGGRG